MFNKFKSFVKGGVEKVMTAKERFQQAIKRPEIIEPYLNDIDSWFLNKDVEKAFGQDVDKDPVQAEKFRRIMKKHFINDIFGLFYNQTKDLKFAKRGKLNDFRYKLLEKVNKSGIKILSNKSTFASTLFTQEISKYFYNLYKNLTPEQLKQLEKMMDGEGEEGDFEEGEGEEKEGKGKGDGKGKPGNKASKGAGKEDSDEAVQEMLEGILNSKESEKALEEAIKKAEGKVELMEKSGIEVNETNAREMIDKVGVLEKHRSDIESLNISKDAILKAVKKILDKSTSYFSSKYKVDEVDIFSAEDFGAMEGMEHLHPAFRKGMVQEIITRERRYYGKYDLMTDNSGSMGSSANLPDHPGVSNMLLAKAIGLKMKRLDLLSEAYEFQNSVTKIACTEEGLLGQAARGGTDLTNVVRKCKETGNNTVVITDGEDNISEYLDNIIFLGVGGINFSYFKQSDAGKRYIENGQCLIFDGQSISYPTL